MPTIFLNKGNLSLVEDNHNIVPEYRNLFGASAPIDWFIRVDTYILSFNTTKESFCGYINEKEKRPSGFAYAKGDLDHHVLDLLNVTGKLKLLMKKKGRTQSLNIAEIVNSLPRLTREDVSQQRLIDLAI
ncbi:MAG: hypothetical protein KJ893_08945 [Candidatus Omnitrophica bacterium]|nr:hypothetical protein [Candidatus Omnitrophota bacterium]MBU4477828.1 hypothetical protein [Candidatus Omnitrophota bacterium]MCG2703459.1 hypothetical protein [Candidatus Omnitrophota bacterium]